MMFIHRLRRFKRFPISINLRNLWIYLLPLLVSTMPACSEHPISQPSSDTAATQPTTRPIPKSQFERDLQFIRNGQFTYVWVFSRPDGKPLDKDDSAYLRANAPQVVDWVTTDEGKRAIGGTNFDLELGGLPLLRKRFVVENYSGK